MDGELLLSIQVHLKILHKKKELKDKKCYENQL